MDPLFLIIGGLSVAIILLIYFFRPAGKADGEIPAKEFLDILNRLELQTKEGFKDVREESLRGARENRDELGKSLAAFREEVTKNLLEISAQNQKAMEKVNATLEEKLLGILNKSVETNTQNRDALSKSLKEFQDQFDVNVKSFNDLQREKFGELEKRQSELVVKTEAKLEEMRKTVDEKLQETLNKRISESFKQVSEHLENVQKGLGEMKTLAQDVGGLKRVLSNVKMRGNLGEVQLSMLLEQILAPDQYDVNVRTKRGGEVVEFAVKLPGKDREDRHVYLPIDAKFPKDAYEYLTEAYESADAALIETRSKAFEAAVKSMAKDISQKYLNPPETTDFGIMFLPFEGIYAEVVRRAALLEEIQKTYKVIVTGPTTLAALLNSLQMGFRTLAIQKRSSEVWNILAAVKKEFENFGGMLEKAQKNLQTASTQIDEVMGKRTKAIQRKLRSVEGLPGVPVPELLPEAEVLAGAGEDTADEE